MPTWPTAIVVLPDFVIESVANSITDAAKICVLVLALRACDLSIGWCAKSFGT